MIPTKQRYKIIIPLMALLMCMSLFIFPMTAYAADADTDTDSPVEQPTAETDSRAAIPAVEAELRGSLLIIHAESEVYEVEAVYINDRRFTYRADTALIIDVSGYITAGDTISVYAADIEGNYSNTVILIPPTPEQPPIPNHITPDGQGEVLDILMNEDNIEFITITTPAGNVFYLVIDHNRADNNVYFLNPVTEWDLLTLAAEAELPVPAHIINIPQTNEPKDTDKEPPTATEKPASQPKTEPTPEEKNGGGRAGLFILLAIAGAGGFGVIYYLKIFKPKREREMYGGEDEEYGEADGFEDVEETDDTDEADGNDDDSKDSEDSKDDSDDDNIEYYKEGEETE